MAVDRNGNTVFCGGFSSSSPCDFDPGPGTVFLNGPGGFLAKYDANGSYVFAEAMPTVGFGVRDIATDAVGNIFLTGHYSGTVDFDPGIGVSNLTSTGGTSDWDIFLAKYDASGNFVYAKSMGGTGPVDEARSIAVDSIGNAYITGTFRSTVDFDPNAGVVNLTSLAPLNDDIFLAKYDPMGNYLYADRLGGLGGDQGFSIAIDNSGNAYITGTFSDTVDFDPGAGVANLIGGYPYTFFAKYDNLGNYVYAKAIQGYPIPTQITIDPGRNAYITGFLQPGPACNFDPGPGTAILTPMGASDIFIAKYDSIGNYIYAKEIGGIHSEQSKSISVNGKGNVYIGGSFNDTLDLDPNGGVADLYCHYNVGGGFIAKYSEGSIDVWPGDSDNNNLANNFDLLPIGLFYGQTGATRGSVSNLWQGYTATNWGMNEPSGADIKHADCNGDGVIDNNDTLAINLNFSLTHAMVPYSGGLRTVNPDMYFTSATNNYLPGSFINVDVMLGTSLLPVNNMYGIAFNVNYDASLVQPGTENLTYPNSWLGTPGTDAIKIAKIDELASTAHGAETRITHTNADGYGRIATFRFQAKNTVTSATAMNFSFTGYAGNDSVGNPIIFNLLPYTIMIDPLTVGITEASNNSGVIIYPNPFTEQTAIIFNEEQKHTIIKITDIVGKEIKTISFTGKQLTLEKGEMSKGIYFVRIEEENKNVVNRKIVVQ